jgi:hypothetical protein
MKSEEIMCHWKEKDGGPIGMSRGAESCERSGARIGAWEEKEKRVNCGWKRG